MDIIDTLLQQAYSIQIADGRILSTMTFEEFELTLRESYPIERDTESYIVNPVIIPDMCEAEFYE